MRIHEGLQDVAIDFNRATFLHLRQSRKRINHVQRQHNRFIIYIYRPLFDRIRGIRYHGYYRIHKSRIRRNGTTLDYATHAYGVRLRDLYVTKHMQVQRHYRVTTAVVRQRVMQNRITYHREVIYRAAEQIIRLHLYRIIIAIIARQAGNSVIDRQGQFDHTILAALVRQRVAVDMTTYAQAAQYLATEQITIRRRDACTQVCRIRRATQLDAQRQIDGRVAVYRAYLRQVIRIIIRTRVRGRDDLTSKQVVVA